ncbi:CBS domain-containing protein [Bacillus sp. Bva_UNVM-123]|uniref:sugar phosphate nucleotidyltransferase n=1 Tax=Bacillus sp. Bva_UNVM-123 TaxID=2829798 RepID=UPI00391F7393
MLDKFMIEENLCLSSVVEKMNQNGHGMVCIVDNGKILKGIFTDGDFRRAIINGGILTDPVGKWMNKNFISIQNNIPLEEGKRILITNRKRHLPVLSGKKLVDILLLNDFETQKTPVVLMVGGLGRRLYPLTKEIPKPMIKVGKKPILEEIIQNLVSQGFTQIILSVNYKKEIIMDYFKDGRDFGATIDYIEEEIPLGTAGSLSLMDSSLSKCSQFIVMNGDILAQVDFIALLKYHLNNKASITVCARKYIINVPFGVLQHENLHLEGIIEKPSYEHLVSSGIYVINREVLQLLNVNEKKDIPMLINDSLSIGNKVSLYELSGYWFDIGTIEELENAKKYRLL